MEKHRHYTIIMDRDGSFQKIAPMHNAMIGQEVYYQTKDTKKSLLHFGFNKGSSSSSFRIITLVCIFLLAFTPFYFEFVKNKTYAYVNIDINPSIELKVNNSLRVLSAAPINQDAVQVVTGLSGYKNKKVEWVIERIMEETERFGLLKNGKNMLVGVSYHNAPNKNNEVLKSVDTYFSKKHSSWQIATFQVPKDIREKAHQKNESMNVIMANRFSQLKDSSKASQPAINRLDDAEKAIIYSFYNREKNHSASNAGKAVNKKESKKADSPEDVKKTVENENEKIKQNKSNSNARAVKKNQPVKAKPKSTSIHHNSNFDNKVGNKKHKPKNDAKSKHKKETKVHKHKNKQRSSNEKRQYQRKWNKEFKNKYKKKHRKKLKFTENDDERQERQGRDEKDQDDDKVKKTNQYRK